jgi:DnaJ-class molecular chaperone
MEALAPAEVRAIAGLLDELDYYQLLEVPTDAPSSAVKRAYYQATRRLHPDHNRHLDGKDWETIQRIARRIAEAYQVLRDNQRRRAYDQQLSGNAGATRIQLVEAQKKAGEEALDAHMGKTPNGRRFFNLARSDIDRGDLAAAQRNLKMAMTFEPTNAAFKKKLAEIDESLKSSSAKNQHMIR